MDEAAPSTALNPLRVAIFAPLPEAPCILQARPSLQKLPQTELLAVGSIAEATAAFEGPEALGVILAGIRTKEDLSSLLAAVAKLRPGIRKGTIRFIVVDQIGHAKILSLLQSKGVKEVVLPALSSRSLVHKVQTSVQMINRVSSTLKRQQEATPTGPRSENRPAPSSKTNSPAARIVWVPPLATPADFWLIDPKNAAKKVLGRWLIELTGPGPSAGGWEPVRIPGSKIAGESWLWRARGDGNNPFQTLAGRWIFFGREPTFDWKSLKWRMAGDRPKLAYFGAGDTEALEARFEFGPEGAPIVAKNSPQAASQFPAIRKTLEAEVRLKDSKNPPSEKKADWNDRQTDGEDTEPIDWNDNQAGDDTEPAEWKKHASSSEDSPPDWKGDAKRDNHLQTRGGITQGSGGKGYGYEDGKFRSNGVPESLDELDDPGAQASERARVARDTRIDEFRESLGAPEERWKTGEAAFTSITIQARIKDALAKVSSPWTDAVFLEQLDTEIWLEIPGQAASLGQILLLELQTQGEEATPAAPVLLPVKVQSLEPAADDRSILFGVMQASAAERLKKLLAVFDRRQEEVAEFLRAARGF